MWDYHKCFSVLLLSHFLAFSHRTSLTRQDDYRGMTVRQNVPTTGTVMRDAFPTINCPERTLWNMGEREREMDVCFQGRPMFVFNHTMDRPKTENILREILATPEVSTVSGNLLLTDTVPTSNYTKSIIWKLEDPEEEFEGSYQEKQSSMFVFNHTMDRPDTDDFLIEIIAPEEVSFSDKLIPQKGLLIVAMVLYLFLVWYPILTLNMMISQSKPELRPGRRLSESVKLLAKLLESCKDVLCKTAGIIIKDAKVIRPTSPDYNQLQIQRAFFVPSATTPRSSNDVLFSRIVMLFALLLAILPDKQQFIHESENLSRKYTNIQKLMPSEIWDNLQNSKIEFEMSRSKGTNIIQAFPVHPSYPPGSNGSNDSDSQNSSFTGTLAGASRMDNDALESPLDSWVLDSEQAEGQDQASGPSTDFPPNIIRNESNTLASLQETNKSKEAIDEICGESQQRHGQGNVSEARSENDSSGSCQGIDHEQRENGDAHNLNGWQQCARKKKEKHTKKKQNEDGNNNRCQRHEHGHSSEIRSPTPSDIRLGHTRPERNICRRCNTRVTSLVMPAFGLRVCSNCSGHYRHIHHTE